MIGDLAEIVAIVRDASSRRWTARMSAIWTFVRKPSNQRLLSRLAGGGAIGK
jgi:hypothetical protein